jgi:hypothetical protein
MTHLFSRSRPKNFVIKVRVCFSVRIEIGELPWVVVYIAMRHQKIFSLVGAGLAAGSLSPNLAGLLAQRKRLTRPDLLQGAQYLIQNRLSCFGVLIEIGNTQNRAVNANAMKNLIYEISILKQISSAIRQYNKQLQSIWYELSHIAF